jgi:DNA polymerase-4
LLVEAGRELDFLHPLPVRRLWGVGEATRASLEGLGVETIGDLSRVPVRLLRSRLGPSLAEHLNRLANGIDERGVEGNAGAKSLSVEETYPEDLADSAAIERALLGLCDRLSSRLDRAEVAGHTITLKVRFAGFETITRSASVADPIALTPALWREIQKLLAKVRREQRGVRLLGVGVSGLVEVSTPHQLTLESAPGDTAAEAVELVRRRFGHDAVGPASLMPHDGPRPGG